MALWLTPVVNLPNTCQNNTTSSVTRTEPLVDSTLIQSVGMCTTDILMVYFLLPVLAIKCYARHRKTIQYQFKVFNFCSLHHYEHSFNTQTYEKAPRTNPVITKTLPKIFRYPCSLKQNFYLHLVLLLYSTAYKWHIYRNCMLRRL